MKEDAAFNRGPKFRPSCRTRALTPRAPAVLRRPDRARCLATAASPPIKRNEVCISRRGNADATRHALIMHFSACSPSFFHYFFIFFSLRLSHFAIVSHKNTRRSVALKSLQMRHSSTHSLVLGVLLEGGRLSLDRRWRLGRLGGGGKRKEGGVGKNVRAG